MIDLTENSKIEEFKTKNHIQYHMKELCDCEEFDRIIRLLTNVKVFLESLG